MTLKTVEEITNILSTRLLFRDGLAIEKIADAFTQDRQATLTALLTALEGLEIDDTCGSCEGTVINTYSRNGENCEACHGTGIDSICYIQNKTLDQAKAIVTNLLTLTV